MSQRTTFPSGLFFPLGLSNAAFFRGCCQLYANKAAYSVKCSTHLVLHFLPLWEQDCGTSNRMNTPRNAFQRLSIAPGWLITCRRPDFTSLASLKPPVKTNILNWTPTKSKPSLSVARALTVLVTCKTQNSVSLFQLPTRTCVTRAERTKLHRQVLYVRLNVKQVQMWKKPQREDGSKEVEWGEWGGGRSTQAGFLRYQVTSGERFGLGVQEGGEKLEHRAKRQALVWRDTWKQREEPTLGGSGETGGNACRAGLVRLLQAQDVYRRWQVYTLYTYMLLILSLSLSLPLSRPPSPHPSLHPPWMKMTVWILRVHTDTCCMVRWSDPILT